MSQLHVSECVYGRQPHSGGCLGIDNPAEREDDARSVPFVLRRRPGMGIRRFIVWRPEPPEDYKRDGLTNAGTKPDIEGVQFSDSTVVIRWMVPGRQSHAVWDDFDTFNAVHGHPEYGTRIEWIDP